MRNCKLANVHWYPQRTIERRQCFISTVCVFAFISLVNDPSIHLFVFLSSWFYFVCVSSFHTGWHSESTSIYDCAVRLARDIFDLAVLMIPPLFPHTPNDVPTLTGEYLCKTAISISILASCTMDILSQDCSWISNGWSSMSGFSSVASVVVGGGGGGWRGGGRGWGSVSIGNNSIGNRNFGFDSTSVFVWSEIPNDKISRDVRSL